MLCNYFYLTTYGTRSESNKKTEGRFYVVSFVPRKSVFKKTEN